MPDYLTVEDIKRMREEQGHLAYHCAEVLESGRPPARELVDHNFYEDDDD